MTDIDINRKIKHRLLAELNTVIAELLLQENYSAMEAILKAQSQYLELLN